ncbi:MAG: preprotein translocase subunit SecE [Thermoflexales bacterium]
MANQEVAEKRPSAIATALDPAREYVRDTLGELRKVHWPTPVNARNLTTVVMVVVIVMAAFLGIFDFLFEQLILGVLRLDLVPLAISVAIILSILVLIFFSARMRRY